MTLTNEDLLAISKLLDVKLDTKFQTELQPIKDEIRDLKVEINAIKTDVGSLKADVESLKADVGSLKADVGSLKADVNTLKSEMESVKASIHAINLHLENVTDRNIQLLAENYVPAAILTMYYIFAFPLLPYDALTIA